jgi:hypothetical protein
VVSGAFLLSAVNIVCSIRSDSCHKYFFFLFESEFHVVLEMGYTPIGHRMNTSQSQPLRCGGGAEPVGRQDAEQRNAASGARSKKGPHVS